MDYHQDVEEQNLDRVGLQGAIGITIWMNIFCAIVLAFLFLFYGTCAGLVSYA